MTQLTEDQLRRAVRVRLDEAVAFFQRSLTDSTFLIWQVRLDEAVVSFQRSLVQPDGSAEAELKDGTGEPSGAVADAEAAGADVEAGWRVDVPVGEWASVRVSQLLQSVDGRVEPRGDGSDFALAFAALVHAQGGRVRLSILCRDAVSEAAAGGEVGGQVCRLVPEARVGVGAADAVRRAHG
jgi:hypothetical protein